MSGVSLSRDRTELGQQGSGVRGQRTSCDRKGMTWAQMAFRRFTISACRRDVNTPILGTVKTPRTQSCKGILKTTGIFIIVLKEVTTGSDDRHQHVTTGSDDHF